MSNTIYKPKTREEWLEFRKHGVGSSEIASVVGANPWQTPYQLWRFKMGIDPPLTENFAMKAGHYLEDAVTLFWSDATGKEVIKSSDGDWIIVDGEKGYLRASPDRTYWIDQNKKKNAKNKGILECKTTQMTIDPENIPKHWFCQVQWQLGIAGLQHGSLAWLTSGRSFGYVDIEFNQEFFDWMVEKVDKFWNVNILQKIEPDLINAGDVVRRFNKEREGKELDVTTDVFNVCNRLKEIKGAIKDLTKEKDELEDNLKLTFLDNEYLSYKGVPIATWKKAKDTVKFDSKAYMEDHPDDKTYLKTTVGARKLLIKK